MLKKFVRWLWPKDEERFGYTEEIALTHDTLHIIHIRVGNMSKIIADDYVKEYTKKIRQASGLDESKFKFIVVGDMN